MKKKYEKPVIEKVKLVPSEAVLAACKTEGATGPQLDNCIVNAFPCSDLGS